MERNYTYPLATNYCVVLPGKHPSFQLLPEFIEMDMANCWHFAGDLVHLRRYFALHAVNVILVRRFYFHSLLLYTCLWQFSVALAQTRGRNWGSSHVSQR
jgi:hypothetical protein